MVAAVDDAALVHDQYLVEGGERGQAVGDHDGGACCPGSDDVADEEVRVCGVEGFGRFVEEEGGRVGEQGAGEEDALALAAGEPFAAFADAGVPALGQVRGPCGEPAELAGGVQPARV